MEICKASAGSGKTHKLTGEYLKMLFSGGTDRYKYILAVTFTNKATGEMKQRVLEELHVLASGGPSAFMDSLVRLENLAREDRSEAEKAVRKHASALLSAILNDYSLFNISTIDRFFQQVLRSFAMETGHFSSYSVELDDESVLSVVVDDLLNTVDENEQLLQWLIDVSMESVENGKDWNSVPKLIGLGMELFKEPYKMALMHSGSQGLTKEGIAACGEKMRGIVSEFQERNRSLAARAELIMQDSGLKPDDFKYSFMKYFGSLAKGHAEAPSRTFVQMADSGPDGWYAKKTDRQKADAIVKAWHDGLADLVAEAARPERFVLYNTAREILRNLTVAGILSDMDAGVKSYCRQNNLVLLSETPKFLSEIIDGSDTPFIYEKVGGRIDNYLLDEFQDTSRMQWDNFEPLVRDSVDSGNSSLIVGDVKQSIYRWRGSDWNLLDSVIAGRFDKSRVRTGTLEYNWRSSREVVEFNNAFFSNVGTLTGEPLITRMYSDAFQQIPQGHDRPAGHVKVVFREGGTEVLTDDAAMKEISAHVERLLSAGYQPGDIAFLVRTKAEGAMISDFLISAGYNIMTEDSLKISSSVEVRRVVEELRTAAGEEKSLYNICEQLLRNGSGLEQNTAFANAFLDCVLEYVADEGSDIGGFLQWWDTVGVERAISAPEGRNAIRVITIHKSKGLEFKAVIVPFLYNPFLPQGNLSKYLWASCSKPPFDMLPVYPLEFRKSLSGTLFAEDYNTEKLYQEVDAVNVAYVAFTRAVRELIIFARYKEGSKGNVLPNTVSHILYGFLKDSLVDGVYESGTWTVPSAGKNKEGMVPVVQMEDFPSVPIGDRLRLSMPPEEYFSEDNMRMKGIVLHDIMSQVEVASNLDDAIHSAVIRGIISEQDSKAVRDRLSVMIASVADRHWFDGTFSLLTEVPILSPGGETYRPDRIMFSEDEAIVVDYKFGKEKKKSYIEQVSGYMRLMRDMGYPSVSGFLWYGDGIDEVSF